MFNLFGGRQPQVQSPCFFSRAYKDQLDEAALAHLPDGVEAIRFPAIDTPPGEFVSNHLMEALNRARSMLVLDGPAAATSFWVAFEQHYARQTGKPLFRYDPKTQKIRRDDEPHKEPSIFASFHGRDRAAVDFVCDWFRDNRNFKVWRDGDSIPVGSDMVAESRQALNSVIDAGGFVVVFASPSSLNSSIVRAEIETAFQKPRPRLIFACLGPPDVALPDYVMERLADRQIGDWRVDLTDANAPGGVNPHRLDDLMVRILYRLYAAQTATG